MSTKLEQSSRAEGQSTEAKIARLVELGSATVFEAQGQKGAVDSALRPIDPAMKLGGRAFTVNSAPADNLWLHEAVRSASPGDILVVDAKGFLNAGAWGDVLTLAAQEAGIRGLVIDGSVRDTQLIVEAGFPVFSRGVSIRGTTKVTPGSVGEPINLAGTPIETGDIIIGDRDGLVVVRELEVDFALERSEAREAAEEELRRRIRDGETTAELLGLLPILKQQGRS